MDASASARVLERARDRGRSYRNSGKKGRRSALVSTVATTWAAIAAGWATCAARASRTRTVVIGSRACVVAAGTIAARARALRARWARLLTVGIVGTRIGVVGRKARRVAGVSIRTRRARLPIALAALTRTLGTRTTRTARFVSEIAFAACGIRAVATASRTWRTGAGRTRAARLVAVRLRRTGVAMAGGARVHAIGHVPAAERRRIAIRQGFRSLGRA